MEQLSPELEDLDRNYKRSTTYVRWNSLPAKTPTTNLGGNRASTLTSHVVNGFGFTTWTPSYNGVIKNTDLARRRRHDSEGNDNDDHYDGKDDDTMPLAQYAPAYNTYAMFSGRVEPYHIRFVRDIPLHYSVVYEPTYSVGHKISDNLALSTNSLNVNSISTAHADDLENFPTMY